MVWRLPLSLSLELFEIALVLVRCGHVASRIPRNFVPEFTHYPV